MARLVVGAVGAVVGFYLGGPVGALQGFTIAYGVSAGLDPNTKVLGPKLSDLRAPTASYGSPIPYLEGSPRVAGCYIWASSKREIATTTTEGKGGPGVDSTVFTYEMDVLIEVAINRCDAVRRIWSNGKLVWSNADDADGETLLASADTTSWRDIRFYDGASDQLPDPTYEAAVGVGNAPAYRTRTTIFIEGLNLGGSGQLPVLTFEIVSEAVDTATGITFADVPATYLLGQGASPFSPTGFQVHIGQWTNTYANMTVNVYDVVSGSATLSQTYEAGSNSPSAHGQTDTAGIMGAGGNLTGGFDPYKVFWNQINAISVVPEQFEFNLPGTEPFNAGGVFGGAQLRFCMLGNDVFFASTSFGSKKIYRYTKTDATTVIGGADPVDSVLSTTYKDALATDGTTLYALAYFGNAIEVYDVATLTLQTTLTGPGAASGQDCSIVVDSGGDLFFINGGDGNVYKWNGAVWTTDLPGVIGAEVSRNSQYGVAGGIIFQMTGESPAPAGTQRVYAFLHTVAQSTVTLDQVVRRLCIRTKQLVDADFDVTALASDVVRSLAITNVGPTRATLEGLGAWYLFEWAEAQKLVAVKRGGASVVTIPYDDLGVAPDGMAEPLPKRRLNDMEQVARVSVRYANVLNDSQDGLEQADRLVTDSSAEVLVEAACGFTPTEAKRLADANTMDLAVAMLQIGPISLSKKYSYLQVGDPFLVTGQDGSTFRVRGRQQTMSEGAISMELVLDDASAISSSAATDSDYTSSTLIKIIAETDLVVLDIPLLRDADDGLGQYLAIEQTGTKWSGARIDESIDNSVFEKIATLTSSTIIGGATTTLGNFTGFGVFDDVSSVTVNVGSETLSSYTKDDAINGLAQPYLIGAELVIACTATFVSAGVYTLSTFLRGQKGTEWAISRHGSGETVVVLQIPGMWKVSHEVADLDAVRYFRATSLGRNASATGTAATDTGVAMMPYAPRDIDVDRTTPAAPVISWRRRSRYNSTLFGTLPLAEFSESYDVEIRNGLTLVESATVSTPTFTAASASTGYTFTVWQNSAVVGRGYPASLVL